MGIKPKLSAELPSSQGKIIIIISKKIREGQGVMELSNCRRGSKPEWHNAQAFLVLASERRGHGGP